MIKKILSYLTENIKREVLAIFILIVLNIVAFVVLTDKIYFRLDLTRDQSYSVSKPTVELLKKLDNKLILEYYYNDKFKEHPQMSKVAQYVEDTLKEYERNGNGNVTAIIKSLNYEKDAETIDKLEKLGIQAFPLSERQKAESKTTLGISGMVINYKDEQRFIPLIPSDNAFEYTLDSEIKKMIDKEGETIGVVFGLASKEFYQDFKLVNNIISSEFQKIKVIGSGESIPDDVTLLVVLGSAKLTDFDAYQVDQFLMGGGKAFIALGGINAIINPQYGQFFGVPAEGKLFEVLESYGLKINKDMLGDNNSYIPFLNQSGGYYQEYRYPIWLRIKQENFNKKSYILSGIPLLNLFWASSIDIDDKVKTKAVVLAKTTTDAWSLKGQFNLDPTAYEAPVQPSEKAYNVACSFEGAVESFYKDKSIPENKNADKNIVMKEKINSGNTKMVLVGNEYFLWDTFLNQSEENQLFLLNSLDWLSKDHSLIEVRKKGKFNMPLDKVRNETQLKIRKNIIIIFTTCIIPILFIVLAIILSVLRFRRNQEIKLKFNKEGAKE